MRIGVVSDTHNHLRNVGRIVELFDAAGVERVVHTGDITQARTLEVLARLDAPLFGVYGNNDLERESLDKAASTHGLHLADPPLRLEWAGRRLLVVHDPRDLDDPESGLCEGDDVALHGHTHRHVWEWRQRTRVFNPGECAGHMTGHNCVGVLDLLALQVELLHF
ncbi:MAG: YfcE family phosphodiesterase [Myxococcota bacterium]